MHDYYTVIARAVWRLESSTAATRKPVYDRARTILIEHLRIRQPPAPALEITREKAALEDAIQKIEWESATASKSRTESLDAPRVGRPDNNRPLRMPDDQAATNRPRGQKTFSKNDRRAKSAKAADNINSRRAPSVGEQRAGVLRGFLAPLGAMFARRLRTDQRPTPRSETRTGPFQSTAKHVRATQLQRIYDDIPNIYKPKAVTTNVPIFSNLVGIQWLDQLMQDAAQPAAPDSLKQDARTVLDRLGLDRAEAIQIEHYDRFTEGFQRYIVECQASSVALDPATSYTLSPMILDDDIRGIFSRLLEREQTAKVFDQALLCFANVWIRTVVVLNVIAVVGLVATAPTLWAGIVRLSDVYSPANVWNWAAQIVALSPAAFAMAWLHRRLKRPWIAALTAFAKAVVNSLIGKSVRSETV